MIPLLDIGAAYRELKSEIDVAIQRVLDSGQYTLGPEVEAFEAEWADYCEARYGVGVGSGLDAMILALKALDIGAGDEVIVPSHTYIGAWLAVTAAGARPVPVEPDPKTYNIAPEGIERAVTASTKALLLVHSYGQPCDLDPILALARRHGLSVIEDAAQAHGARYKGRRIGGHGDAVCWSFHPSKNLGEIGDAGAVTTNRSDVANQIRLLRNNGSRERYVNTAVGVNSRLDTAQAAILRAKLPHLDAWNERRRKIAAAYTAELAGNGLVLPFVADWAEPSWYLYVIRSKDRDLLQRRLIESGITTSVHYPKPPHLQDIYAQLACSIPELPLTTRLAAEVLSLPITPQISFTDADLVIAAVKNAASS